MPKPMTIYRPEVIKHPEHSFNEINSRRMGKIMAYHNYGGLKTYSNITQAENRVQLLKSLGFDCFRTFSHPFLILLNK
jgi:hypothetical protein